MRTGGPLGGLGYDIRMRPDNPDIMFVTDAKAGVFKSTDGGRTWVPKNNGITTRLGTASDEIPVFCLTIDPNNYDTIWARHPVPARLLQVHRRRRVLDEDGQRRRRTRPDHAWVRRGSAQLRTSSTPPARSPAGNGPGRSITGREFDLVKGVVYKTTNGGQSWRKVWEGDNLARYVWIDPRDTDVVYVSTGIFDREAANSDVPHGQNGGVGVLKSTDGGQTWQQINNGLGNLYVGSLFMHPTEPGYAAGRYGKRLGQSGSGRVPDHRRRSSPGAKLSRPSR